MGLNGTIDITSEQNKIIHNLLTKHLPNAAVWVYGSRVNGTARDQSDLDMVIFASSDQKKAVSDLKEALEESNLPFRVDLFTWDELPEQFRRNIQANHVILVNATNKQEAS